MESGLSKDEPSKSTCPDGIVALKIKGLFPGGHSVTPKKGTVFPHGFVILIRGGRRVDKKWYFNRWSINAYVDIQNIYNYQIELQPFLTVQRDVNGQPIEDPNDPTKYLIKPIENISGTVLPSIGLMVEF